MLILLFLIAAILLAGGYYAYRLSCFSPKEGREKEPFFEGSIYTPFHGDMKVLYNRLMSRPCETVTVTSHDGLTLTGYYFHTRDNAPVDICFHGYRSTWKTDFCGGSDISYQMGHNLLLVDQRAHGKSEGNTITFGLLERLDLVQWVNYITNRFGSDTPIFLYGVSMGGGTVLMAPQDQLPANVKGIVADCPFSNALDIICHVGKDKPVPNWLIKPFALVGAAVFGGFSLCKTNARQELSKAKIPVLILHGETDTLVPPEMSDLVSCNPKYITRYTFPGAEHAVSFLMDQPRYRKIVTEFVEKALCKSE